MPKVGGIVEEPNEEDEKLRQEFDEFGETLTDKITDKNRAILIKKLNHLKARRRMSEKLSQSVLKETSPKKPAASKRGRGRKGKSVKNEPSRESAMLDDELNAAAGDLMNETFSVSDMSSDTIQPPVKQSRVILTNNNVPYASDGPYAVARKRAAGKDQNIMPNEPSQSESTGMEQQDVPVSKPLSPDFGQTFHLPAKSAVPKRGRTRTVGDLRGSANTASVPMASDCIDGGSNAVEKSSLPKRNARASALPAAAALPSSYTQEETIAECTSASVPLTDIKTEVPSAEERGRGASRGQQRKPTELSKSLVDEGKQNAASRIPKLARFPTPPSQQVSSCSK